MRSTATHAAWSVYVSVCCRVTSVSYAKNDWIDGDAVWVWTHAPQGTVTVLDGSRISHAREKVLLGKFWYLGKLRLASGRYSQPYLQSGSSDVASGYGFHRNLFILLFSWYCSWSCFSGLQLGIDIPSRLLPNVGNWNRLSFNRPILTVANSG